MENKNQHFVGEFAQKALMIKDGTILMCKGLGDTDWDLLGGRLHFHEDLTEGLQRELKEELEDVVWVTKDTFTTIGAAPDWLPVLEKFFA